MNQANRNGRSRLRSAMLLVAAFVLGGMVLPYLHITWSLPGSRAETVGLNVHQAPAAPLSPDEIYAHAAQIAYKSVVNIDATQRVRMPGSIFDDMMGVAPQYGDQTSSGSGVIITSNGYILTNEHVVHRINDSKQVITVTLTTGQKLRGHLVGGDYTNDVALIKVNGTNLPVAHLGTSKGLVPGQMCVAIGNPYNLHFTVTNGVIGALDRAIAMPNGRIYPHLIQHDAPINPGNSGGPLVNLKGQVIGINTLVQQRAEGIGFAIPIDTALSVAQELKKYGKIIRPWIGVAVVSNSSDLAAQYGLPNIQGAVVTGVYRNSPAAVAQLQPGDVITRINGRRVTDETSFNQVEDSLKVGEKISLRVHRGNQYADVTVTTAEKP